MSSTNPMYPYQLSFIWDGLYYYMTRCCVLPDEHYGTVVLTSEYSPLGCPDPGGTFPDPDDESIVYETQGGEAEGAEDTEGIEPLWLPTRLATDKNFQPPETGGPHRRPAPQVGAGRLAFDGCVRLEAAGRASEPRVAGQLFRLIVLTHLLRGPDPNVPNRIQAAAFQIRERPEGLPLLRGTYRDLRAAELRNPDGRRNTLYGAALEVEGDGAPDRRLLQRTALFVRR